MKVERAMNEIFWISPSDSSPNAPPLAIVLRPRGGEWLEDELQRFKHGGYRHGRFVARTG